MLTSFNLLHFLKMKMRKPTYAIRIVRIDRWVLLKIHYLFKGGLK